ncbi:translation initiation factor IF-3 [Mycoplasma suis]|uniref:hypothetical protein n=1 Tax=Mycoplasma suis TaxID=57372 RepID=UPI00031CBA1C|nr:hypothetical protein [Mycoplasma suis]
MFTKAEEKGLDLMLVNSSLSPHVVKLVNYESFIQEKKKQEYQSSKKEKIRAIRWNLLPLNWRLTLMI